MQFHWAEKAKSGDVSVYPLQTPSGLRQAECNISDAPECRIQGGMTKVWQRHIEEVPTQKTAFRGKDMWQDFWRRPLVW